MKTFKDLKEEIKRIKALDVEGFDNAWVLKKFARDQALINIHLIKPYTNKYSLIVRFLVTGKDADESTAAAAAAYDTDATDATNAAAYAAYSADSDASNAAAYATSATSSTDYTKAIESLNTLANEYLAFLL